MPQALARLQPCETSLDCTPEVSGCYNRSALSCEDCRYDHTHCHCCGAEGHYARDCVQFEDQLPRELGVLDVGRSSEMEICRRP